MKQMISFAFVLLAFTCIGQKVKLQWKIAEKDSLRYLTVMKEMDSSELEVHFEGLFKSLSDSTGKKSSAAKEMLRTLSQSIQNTDFVTTLSNKGNGVIDIVMSTRPKPSPAPIRKDSSNTTDKEMLRMVQSMAQGVMLRGSVYATGGIHSFWVKSNQKNLIATFFELPKQPVQPGDTWPLDINLIANDQNFACDSSYKFNEVKLVELKKVNGETIAVISYHIVEYVNGIFSTPNFSGAAGQQKTMMKFTHEAIAEFSVDKGRWLSYDGIMTLDASGVMTAKKKTRLSLVSE